MKDGKLKVSKYEWTIINQYLTKGFGQEIYTTVQKFWVSKIFLFLKEVSPRLHLFNQK